MRTAIAALLALTAAPALAQDYVPPAPGTRFVYESWGENGIVTTTHTVLAADESGFFARVEGDGVADPMLMRVLYGVTSHTCAAGWHPFEPGMEALFPLAAGKWHPDGAFLVIGPDMEFRLGGETYDTWAVREVTEHGSTWVTRFAPALGTWVDHLVAIETVDPGPVPEAEIAACR